MTPGARVAAAIEVLDAVQDGMAAEQALTRWARSSRYAGSKDRAAVRDHVFDVLRRKRSAAALGGGEDGRALMIGALRQAGAPIDALFSGEGHAPEPLSEFEARDTSRDLTRAETWNLPDWLLPEVERSLGDAAEAVALALQDRAPVTLRVNLGKTTPEAARAALAGAGIATRRNSLAETALTVTEGAGKLRNSPPYLDGRVELQDAASQAVVARLPAGGRVLDYCAGGGGKALALAMDAGREVFAHDIDPRRMQDLPERAARAGAVIEQVDTDALGPLAPFDLVLCDAPCSGSGSWRRAPGAKWALTPGRLDELVRIQAGILDDAAVLVGAQGMLAYVTCSVLACENEDQVSGFLARHAGWRCLLQDRFNPDADGDGFFVAHLTRV